MCLLGVEVITHAPFPKECACLESIIHNPSSSGLGWISPCVGRALEWHSRGQRFDPAYLHHLFGHIVYDRLLRKAVFFCLFSSFVQFWLACHWGAGKANFAFCDFCTQLSYTPARLFFALFLGAFFLMRPARTSFLPAGRKLGIPGRSLSLTGSPWPHPPAG